jgi:type IV secretion system protein VirB9
MRLLLAIAALLISFPAQGQDDPRLQTVPFRPGVVQTLKVVPGYVTTVILSPEERIQTMAVGNTAAWEVTAAKSGDLLFVRPLATGISTNLEVVTDGRHYSFLLKTTFEADPAAMFQLRFDYSAAEGSTPARETKAPESVEPIAPAVAYRIRGDRLARPLSVSDDGERTFFSFGESAALPAIYGVDETRQETLVTLRKDGDLWCVDRLWGKFIFRNGRAVAEAFQIKQKARQ